jgi:polyphosphate kinase
MLSLVPGVRGVSENIRAIGIVDRFLEHSRFMIFSNGGDEQVYITSADLMPRNLDRRIEVACPIWDPALKKEINDLFEIQWSDTVKARLYDEAQSNRLVKPGTKPVHSQIEIHGYIRELNVQPREAIQE